MKISTSTFSVALAMSLFCSAVKAQVKVVHSLTIAAHPSNKISNEEADAIISNMNKIMKSDSFSWDTKCNEVEFIRSGNVINDSNLAKSGTYEELQANLRRYQPSADVLLVTSISCNGIPAAGCGKIGTEPVVAAVWPAFNSLIWLHERGHNVGLAHSADGPEMDDEVPENIGKRFMFWLVDLAHVGKTDVECSAFKNANFQSISRLNQKQQPTIAASSTLQSNVALAAEKPTPAIINANAMLTQNIQPQSSTNIDTKAQIKAAADAAGLTLRAFKIVSIPWLDGAPIKAIERLDTADLDSIRSMLKRQPNEPNEYTSQAITVLGIRGDESDIALIKSIIERPAPAVIPGMEQNSKQALRSFARVKLAAPVALGILANRTQSKSAVSVLKETANESKTKVISGPEIASDVSKNALQGLSIANTPESKEYIEAVIRLQKPEALPEAASAVHVDAAQAPALNSDEIKKLEKSSAEMQQHGIDKILQPNRF